MPSSFTLHSKDLGGVATPVHRHTSIGGGNQSPTSSGPIRRKEQKALPLPSMTGTQPTGSGFWHWLAVNIPASVRELHADAGNPATRLMPEQAVQIRNDAGFTGYSGSFPPPGHGWHLVPGHRLCAGYGIPARGSGYPGRPGRLPALAAHAGKSIPRLLRPGTGKITCTGENHRFYRASGLAAFPAPIQVARCHSPSSTP